jgi:hypothetical protein
MSTTYQGCRTTVTTYQLDDYVPRGSSLRGHVKATYIALVDTFGEPNILNAESSGDDKVHNEWGIRFSDGDDDIYATIYDWKEMDAYDSHIGEYRWHIGGRQIDAVWCVMDALNAPETMTRIDA